MKKIKVLSVVMFLFIAIDLQARPKKVEIDIETGLVSDDSALVEAHRNQRRAHFIEAANMDVVQLLPDDTDGLEHQKWVVRLSSGQKITAIYNSDMCPRVPLKVGDKVSMGGEYIWSKKVGGLFHWLHHDPRGNRPDGYVYLNGQYYCK